MSDPIRIANCSGFYGDRQSAAREMVEGGPIDVLTGDWLAELTMLILAKDKQRRGDDGGYARTFVRQVEDVLALCLERGIRIVSNAGGLDPAACAAAVREVADKLGLSPTIAYITGDDATHRLDEIRAIQPLVHLDTGEELGEQAVLTANAYLGGFGIAEALGRGADIVIAGRVTDAAVVLGPAAWHHGWARDDWDALAGAVAAGHVIECGAQATGGNFAGFTELDDLVRPGFPIAEIAADGSSVITKHDGHGGAVTVDTVTAQLLYEIGPPTYLNPDVTSHFDTLQLTQEAPNRVRMSGVTGSPAPATSKLGITLWGGFRTTLQVPLTGLDIEAKAALVQRQLWDSLGHGPERYREFTADLLRTDHADPSSNEAATAWLRLTFRDDDQAAITKTLQRAFIELALSTIPGMYLTGESTQGQAYGTFFPTLVPASLFPQTVHLGDDTTFTVEPASASPPVDREPPATLGIEPVGDRPTTRAPLGTILLARAGDKGGNANLGVWARTDLAHAWLRSYLTSERLQALLPETAALTVDRHELANLRALNFVIHGLLGDGVAAGPRQDGQAKSLGEYLRAKHADIPTDLLLPA